MFRFLVLLGLLSQESTVFDVLCKNCFLESSFPFSRTFHYISAEKLIMVKGNQLFFSIRFWSINFVWWTMNSTLQLVFRNIDSLSQCVGLLVHLFISLPEPLCLVVYLSLYFSFYFFLSPFFYMHPHNSLWGSVCLSVSPSIHLFVHCSLIRCLV